MVMKVCGVGESQMNGQTSTTDMQCATDSSTAVLVNKVVYFRQPCLLPVWQYVATYLSGHSSHHPPLRWRSG